METIGFDYKFNNLNDTHPKSDNIAGLNIQLMNHQKTSIYHAEILERNNGFSITLDEKKSNYYDVFKDFDVYPKRDVYCNFGIIACKVGSGKSFVALGLIAKKKLLYFDRTVSDIKSSLCFSFKKIMSQNYTVSTNIILVPHNLFSQWKSYISSYTNLDAVFISSSKELIKTLDKMREYEGLFKKMTVPDELENFQEVLEKSIKILKEITENKVYLISNKVWNNFANCWSLNINKQISRLFIDEVHSMELPNSAKIKTNFIWFITSSIEDLSRHRNKGFISDTISNYYTFVDKNIRDYLVIKNNDNYVDSSLRLPQPVITTINCRALKILNIFEGIINQDVKNMLLAEDIQGVVSYLGLTPCNETDIIKVLCSNMEKELENAKISLNAKMMMHYHSEQSKQEAIEKIKEKISSIEEKIENVRKRIIESDVDPILHTDIENPVITFCCKNKFDLESITSYYEFNYKKYSAVNCPLCREKLEINKLVFMGDIKFEQPVENTGEYIYENHTKIENLEYLLTNKIELNKRILIFSEFEGNFTTIEETFAKSGRNNLSPVKGSIGHITSLIEKYNSGEIPNLFLNAKYCASGLNMEKTDIIIIMHKMSEDNIKQVIGRGNRIGRVGSLQVYFLYAVNECMY